MSPCRQDLECDVSVEEDNRQEWIFTLYDFDNSGKVTKEVRLLFIYSTLILPGQLTENILLYSNHLGNSYGGVNEPIGSWG